MENQNKFTNIEIEIYDAVTKTVLAFKLFLDIFSFNLTFPVGHLSVSNLKQAEMSVMTFIRSRKLTEDARSHFFKKNVFNRNFFI